MRSNYAPRQRRYSFATAVVMAIACAGQQPPAREFTRPTLIAAPLPTQPRTREVIHEDDQYKFASQNFGTAEARERHGLFVFSKTRGSWIEVLALSTEHARLGRTPEGMLLPVSWDYGYLRAKPYVPPWMPGDWLNFPDRVIVQATPAAYRLDFNSRFEHEVALTSLWLLKSDLEPAFDGRRTMDLVAPDLVAADVIPMELQSDAMIVPVSTDSDETHSLRWSIDTKAADVILDPAATRLASSKGKQEGRVSLKLGRVAVPNQIVRFDRASAWNNLGGVLGGTFFDRYLVSIDYDNARIRLRDPKTYEKPAAAAAIPVEWRRTAPTLVARVGNGGTQFDVRLCVDTSEMRALVLRKFGNQTRVASLGIGPFQFDNFPVVVEHAIPGGCEGVIGNGLLKRFHATFDRGGRRLLLEPGALLHVPYDYDLTGMSIVANGGTFAVSRVVYESIAWNAGIRSGDVIREIDGRPASAMSLQDLRSAFIHDGRQVSLSIYNVRTPQTLRMSMPDLK